MMLLLLATGKAKKAGQEIMLPQFGLATQLILASSFITKEKTIIRMLSPK